MDLTSQALTLFLLLTRLVLNEQYPSKMPADQVPLACRLSAEVASRDTFGQSLGQLRPYITSYLDDLNTAIQQRALADVNNWLVCLHRLIRRITSL